MQVFGPCGAQKMQNDIFVQKCVKGITVVPENLDTPRLDDRFDPKGESTRRILPRTVPPWVDDVRAPDLLIVAVHHESGSA